MVWRQNKPTYMYSKRLGGHILTLSHSHNSIEFRIELWYWNEDDIRIKQHSSDDAQWLRRYVRNVFRIYANKEDMRCCAISLYPHTLHPKQSHKPLTQCSKTMDHSCCMVEWKFTSHSHLHSRWGACKYTRYWSIDAPRHTLCCVGSKAALHLGSGLLPTNIDAQE